MEANYESAKANKQINKDMSNVDMEGFNSVFGRMEDKVLNMEAEADAYEQINNENKSEEDIIAAALEGDSETADDDLFSSFMSDEKTEKA